MTVLQARASVAELLISRLLCSGRLKPGPRFRANRVEFVFDEFLEIHGGPSANPLIAARPER